MNRCPALALLIACVLASLACTFQAGVEGATPRAPTWAAGVADTPDAPPAAWTASPSPVPTVPPTPTVTLTLGPTAEVGPPPGPDASLEAFKQYLREAVGGRSEPAMAAIMADPFTGGAWQTQWQSDSASVSARFIAQQPALTFVEPPSNLPDILGRPVLTIPPDDAGVVDYLFAIYPGMEKILFISQDASGAYRWWGTLHATPSFAGMVLTSSPEYAQVLLIHAIRDRDVRSMAVAMTDPFGLAIWRGSAESLPAREAAERLNAEYLPFGLDGSTIPGNNIMLIPPDLLIRTGIDPTTFWGTDWPVEAVLYCTGWGSDGLGEALLVLVRLPDGSLRWSDILIAPAGF